MIHCKTGLLLRRLLWGFHTGVGVEGLGKQKKGGDRETFKKGIGRIGRLGKIGLGGGIRSIQSWGSVAGVDILVRGGQG